MQTSAQGPYVQTASVQAVSVQAGPIQAQPHAPKAAPFALRPVLFVARCFGTCARLASVALLLLLPGGITLLAYANAVNSKIDFAASERHGVAVLTPALKTLADTVSGATVDLSTLSKTVQAHPELHLSDDLAKVQQAMPGANTPAGRVELASRLTDLITEDGNNSNLILDPDLDSFYVMDAQVVQTPTALLTAAQATLQPTGSNADAVANQAVLAGTLANAAASLSSDLDTAIKHTAHTALHNEVAALYSLSAAVSTMAKSMTASLAAPAASDPHPVAATAEAAIASGTKSLDELLQVRIDNVTSQRDLRVLICLVGVVLAGWAAVAISWQTRRDVSLTLTAVQAIADGDDTDHDLPASGGEFGAIGTALIQARQQLAHQQQELAASIEEQERTNARALEEQHTRDVKARKAGQLVVAETAGTIVDELQSVLAQVITVREGAQVIDTQASGTDRLTRVLVAQAGEAEQTVQALDTALESIAGMASLIARVAEQTNLLALNASIEAARAGDAGRGFQIVAGEVKALAATTAQSTDEITATIRQVEEHAQSVATAISGMARSVTGIDGAAETLRTVAADQRAVVASLDATMSATISRVEQMRTTG